MTQQPYYPPQYPQAPPQQYPQQGYPAPAAPQPYAAPPANYPQAPAQQPYPPQYAAPAPAAPPVPLAQGSIDDFYSQPSTGGGGSLKFTGANNQPLIGQSYVFKVLRPLGPGDVQQQTNNQGVPQTFKDGRPKFVMIVPVQLLEPSPNHPDGLAKWYVKGATRDELSRAMAEAGAPEGAPEAGAVIRVTLTGTRQSGPGMNPAHVFAVQYVRPEGAQPVAQAAAQAAQVAQGPAAPSPVAEQQPVFNYTAPPANQPLPPQYAMPGQQLAPLPESAYAPGAQQLPPAPQQVAPPAQPQQQLAAPAGMPADQAELLQRILAAQGQQQAPQQ